MRGFLSGVFAAGLGLVVFAAASAQPNQRFDYLVRGDMFAGFEGDEEAFERALTLCERTLAENPDHAEALVWHGAATFFRGGRALAAGGRDQAIAFFSQGLAEMNRAVALAPDNIGVRIPRGAVLLTAGLAMPEGERARDYIRTAIGDYERSLALQEPAWPRMSVHARGELAGGLAEGWSRLGEGEKARAYLTRMAELAGKYADAANERLADPTSRRPITCLGCHTSK